MDTPIKSFAHLRAFATGTGRGWSMRAVPARSSQDDADVTPEEGSQLGPSHLARKALWLAARRDAVVYEPEVRRALPRAEERALLLTCMRLAGIRIEFAERGPHEPETPVREA